MHTASLRKTSFLRATRDHLPVYSRLKVDRTLQFGRVQTSSLFCPSEQNSTAMLYDMFNYLPDEHIQAVQTHVNVPDEHFLFQYESPGRWQVIYSS